MVEQIRRRNHLFRSFRMSLVGLLVCVVARGAALPRSAEAEVTLTVAPSLVELEAEGGATGSQTLTVSNDGNEPIEVAAGVEPYKGATGALSAVEWLTVEPARFRLEPGQAQEVTVEIALPEGELEAGGRYAAVALTTGAKQVEGSGMAMAGKLAVPFLLKVDGRGDLVREIALPKFAPVLAADGRVGFTALLRNEGNLHVVPQGEVIVDRADGSSYARLDVPRTTAVLPGTDVLLGTQGTIPLEPGVAYEAKLTVDAGTEEPTEAAVDFSPEVALEVAGVSVCENLDRGPSVRIDLRNDGGLGLVPRVHASVRGELGGPRGTAPPGDPVLVWPAETAGVVVDLPERLVSGGYVLTVRVDVTPPDREGRVAVPPIEQDSTFRIGGLGGDAVPLCGA